jgi:hypothetical protein
VCSDPIWSRTGTRSLLILQWVMRLIQCGLVVFLLAFSRHLTLPWRQQSFGIALGFGLYASVDLISYALCSGGHISQRFLNLYTMTGYNVGVVIWLVYSFWNSQRPATVVLVPQRWENALMDIQSPDEPESLIPMFEHMVDRAFSRTQDRRA